jgi:uroporphyrinogen-III synthase
MPVHVDPNINYGTNLWFTFTAASGISKLFTYTPKFSEGQEQQPQAAISEGTEDTLDTKSP